MLNKPFPPEWWDGERVRRVLAHYEAQTEEEAVTEDERAFDEGDRTIKDLEVLLILQRDFTLVD